MSLKTQTCFSQSSWLSAPPVTHFTDSSWGKGLGNVLRKLFAILLNPARFFETREVWVGSKQGGKPIENWTWISGRFPERFLLQLTVHISDRGDTGYIYVDTRAEFSVSWIHYQPCEQGGQGLQRSISTFVLLRFRQEVTQNSKMLSTTVAAEENRELLLLSTAVCTGLP